MILSECLNSDVVSSLTFPKKSFKKKKTYDIQDHTCEKTFGKFYEEELSVIKKKDDVFRIAKVLRRKTVRG